MNKKVVCTELTFHEGEIIYIVVGNTYEVKEELKKAGFEWNPSALQWEMVLTGTQKEIVAKAKELNKQIEAFAIVNFSAKDSNIALRKAFAK